LVGAIPWPSDPGLNSSLPWPDGAVLMYMTQMSRELVCGVADRKELPTSSPPVKHYYQKGDKDGRVERFT